MKNVMELCIGLVAEHLDLTVEHGKIIITADYVCDITGSTIQINSPSTCLRHHELMQRVVDLEPPVFNSLDTEMVNDKLHLRLSPTEVYVAIC